MDLEDIGWNSTDWTHVAHDKDYWQAVVVVPAVAYFRSNHTHLVAQFLFSGI